MSGVDGVTGLEKITTRAVRFVFEQLATGAATLDAEALRKHADVDGILQPVRMVARGAPLTAITAVAVHTDEVLVSSEHGDGTPREWTFHLGHDGRIDRVSAGRPVDGVEFWAGSPGATSDADRDDLQGLFAAAYTDPDPGYLDRQLEVMSCLAVARRDRAVVGFAMQGGATVGTNLLGPVRLLLPGLVCVDPHEHRSGVGQGLGNRVMWLNSSTNGPSDVAAGRFATPASLAMAMKGRDQFVWPPADDPFALYDHPTPAQVELAHEAAIAHGSNGYDPATGASVGLGRPVGTPNVEPDVSEEYRRRFEKIDRERGDSLLYLRWTVDPPSVWFDT